MKKNVILLVAALFLVAAVAAEAKARDEGTPPAGDDPLILNGDQTKPPMGCIKWSQLPEMIEPWGLDIESNWDPEDGNPNVIVMDDWMCLDGLPITDVHWWGSYLIAGAAPALGFRISVHADIPAEPTGLPSHPGELLAQWTFSPTEVFVNFHGTDANMYEVFQYFVYLPEPFCQERNKVYWLDIQAIVPQAPGPIWGWHTASTHNIDDAVQIFDYNHDTGGYSQWIPIEWQGISLDMAFELTTVPEPLTMIMMGSAVAGLAAFTRKRK